MGRARAPYSTQACTICRARKSKCDGLKPLCGPCRNSGRDNECSWGRDAETRKLRTGAHFEALQKRLDLLQNYADLLERSLANCVCQDVSLHLRFRPEMELDEPSEREAGESDSETLDSDDDITQELTIPARCLKFDDNLDGLVLHGITAPLRFGSKPLSKVLRITEVVETHDATYILHIDGVTLPDSQLELDWSRHLPPEVALDRAEHDNILGLAFKFLTPFSLAIVPSLFLRDMYRALSAPRSQIPPRTPHYSPMLHNSLLAVSATFSDNPYIRDSKTRQYFINVALDFLQAKCRKPDLSAVPAFAFLGTYYADNGDRILSDLFYGMSSRISMALGLGVDSAAWVNSGVMTRDESLARNWAYWTAFSEDVCSALYFGREFCGAGPRQGIPMPFVDEESDQIPWSHTPAISPRPNCLTLTFSAAASLFVIAREIIDTVTNLEHLHETITAERHVAKIDLELNSWKDRLPPELQTSSVNRDDSTPHRLMLHCQYWWCFIVLHRPFFNQHPQPIRESDQEVDHIKLCKRAAENILELAESWSSAYTLRYTPMTMLQVLFSAGTIFLLLALRATANLRVAQKSLHKALEQTDRCVCYLHEMGQTWKCAARTGDILQVLLHNKLGPIITRRLAHRGIPLSIATVTSFLSRTPTSLDREALNELPIYPQKRSPLCGDGEWVQAAGVLSPLDASIKPVDDWGSMLPGINVPGCFDDFRLPELQP
ncbi:hypothetical protein B0H15DRAFT_467886 [Mycena belliarum]|uniref:Zn(2)-C6 fungal-type domain-containing protein n=1 Tax=Mycena belliarum TaxID=1033014 RepID=A0AAD6XN23_9AGAR|nr:hypothetical protein B0H15DRAFT_467886 [Mycena belliae]